MIKHIIPNIDLTYQGTNYSLKFRTLSGNGKTSNIFKKKLDPLVT